jgi:hypothetical protein
MKSAAYRACISLGAGCATAHHIRRCLWQPEAYFFDWLVTPMPALITLLRTDLRSLFQDKEAFRPQEAPPTPYLAMGHQRLGVISYHDFRREEQLRDFPQVREKYAFLADRWGKTIAAGGPILFVRHLVDRDECIALVETLKEAYRDLEFSILAVAEGREPPVSWNLAGVCNTVIGPTPFELIGTGRAGPETWKGDSEGWQEAFRLVGAIK